jgi:hypothetical protein
MLKLDIHFIQFLTLLALGFISGKFISTSLIQISIWERVKDLGVKPPITSTILIYIKQTFCGWNSDLAPRCLLISLMTSLIFVTFWVRYGISPTFYFCCVYSLFNQIYLFAWLDKKNIPEAITIIFIGVGTLAVYLLDKKNLIVLIIVLFIYLMFQLFKNLKNYNPLNSYYSNLLSFIFPSFIWFNIQPTLVCIALSYITATLIGSQKSIEGNYYNYELLTPIMSVFFFIYLLFKFPSILQNL